MSPTLRLATWATRHQQSGEGFSESPTYEVSRLNLSINVPVSKRLLLSFVETLHVPSGSSVADASIRIWSASHASIPARATGTSIYQTSRPIPSINVPVSKRLLLSSVETLHVPSGFSVADASIRIWSASHVSIPARATGTSTYKTSRRNQFNKVPVS